MLLPFLLRAIALLARIVLLALLFLLADIVLGIIYHTFVYLTYRVIRPFMRGERL